MSASEHKIIDYPKIKSPFVRKSTKGQYLVTPEIEEGYEWVFEDSGVRAVDKLHGTNICVIIEDGVIQCVDNRGTRIMNSPDIHVDINTHSIRMLQGVLKAVEKMHIKEDGRIYGELIGPTVNGNIHGVSGPTFVPFDYLVNKCHWKSWVSNQYPKDFDSISEWFKELPSLYSKKHGRDGLAEGLVFTHPDGRKAKLRRDMFEWYQQEENPVVGDEEKIEWYQLALLEKKRREDLATTKMNNIKDDIEQLEYKNYLQARCNFETL